MTKVLTLKKTCLACPSQWEGDLEDGRAVYARFRHGHLSVGIGGTVKEAVGNAMSDQALYEGDIGDRFDGFMDFDELKARLRGCWSSPPTSSSRTRTRRLRIPRRLRGCYGPEGPTEPTPVGFQPHLVEMFIISF
jgi:hypothetical protein